MQPIASVKDRGNGKQALVRDGAESLISYCLWTPLYHTILNTTEGHIASHACCLLIFTIIDWCQCTAAAAATAACRYYYYHSGKSQAWMIRYKKEATMRKEKVRISK